MSFKHRTPSQKEVVLQDTVSREATEVTLGQQRRGHNLNKRDVTEESESFDMSTALAELKSRTVRQLGEPRSPTTPQKNEYQKLRLESEPQNSSIFDIKVEPSQEVQAYTPIEVSPSLVPKRRIKDGDHQDRNMAIPTHKKKAERSSSKRGEQESTSAQDTSKPMKRELINRNPLTHANQSQSDSSALDSSSERFQVKMKEKDSVSPRPNGKSELVKERISDYKHQLKEQLIEGSEQLKKPIRKYGKQHQLESESTNMTESSEPQLQIDDGSIEPGSVKRRHKAAKALTSGSIDMADTEESSKRQKKPHASKGRRGKGWSTKPTKSTKALNKEKVSRSREHKSKSRDGSKSPIFKKHSQQQVSSPEESSSLVQTRGAKRKIGAANQNSSSELLGKRQQRIDNSLASKRSKSRPTGKKGSRNSKSTQPSVPIQHKRVLKVTKAIPIVMPKKIRNTSKPKRKLSMIETHRKRSKSRDYAERERSRKPSREVEDPRGKTHLKRVEGRPHDGSKKKPDSVRRMASPSRIPRLEELNRRDRSNSLVTRIGRKSKIQEEHSDPVGVRDHYRSAVSRERDQVPHPHHRKEERQYRGVSRRAQSPNPQQQQDEFTEQEERTKLLGIFDKASTQELKAMLHLYHVATKVTKKVSNSLNN